ncbi:MAG: isochorismatase family protein, partial [Candidatus Hodarchaeales archaeon]
MTSKTSLLIIDMQMGNFIGQNPIYNGIELVKKVEKLIHKARTNNILLIYIQNCGGQGDPDEPDTPGWEIHSALSPKKDDIVIQKNTPDS